MSKQIWTDQQLITAIRGNDEQRNAAFAYIVHQTDWRQSVLKTVYKQGGDENMGREVFTETLVELDKNIRSGNFRGEAKLKTYYLSIVARYHVRKKQKNKSYANRPLSPPEDHPKNLALQHLLTADQRKYLDLLLSKFGERCKQIMQLRHRDYAYREIADAISSLNSEGAARREYARCQQRIKKLIKEDPNWKNLLNQLRWH